MGKDTTSSIPEQKKFAPGVVRSLSDRVVDAPTAGNVQSCFTAKTANQWIEETRHKPIPKSLYGPLIVEDEITVLFASTNVGKSILAVQIGQAIASGQSTPEFPTDRAGRKVLFFDFELSARQFARRYALDDGSHFHTPFEFSENFIRLENGYANPFPGQTMDEYYLQAIKTEIDRHGANVVIIDNLTWINGKLEKSRDAAPFMQQLAMLKRELGLTLILISHTPKRDPSKPIDITDLAGSSMVGNFLDAAIAIGRSKKDPGLRYIKQVKARDGEIILSEENVASCALEKENSFLGFRFLEYGPERDHLKEQSEDDRAGQLDKIISMYQEGKSLRQIQEATGIGKSSVDRIIKKHATDLTEAPF